MLRARTKREIALGYKEHGEADVKLNPRDKTSKLLSLAYTQIIVVMAEDAVA